MAPKRTKIISTSRRTAIKQAKRRRRPTRPAMTFSLGSLLVKGVNTLLSVIPGAKIFAPVADFAFKSIGLKQGITVDGDFVAGTTLIYGVSAAFTVPLSTIIQDSAQMIRSTRTDNTAQKDIITAYSHGRLLQIRVHARPIGQLSYRQGTWALAFIPFSAQESEAFYAANTSPPTLRDVLCIPGAVQGSGTKPLTVNYRARRNTFDALTHPLDTKIGMVMVTYEDLSRAKGEDFGPEDFGVEIIISGAVYLSTPIPHAGWSKIDCRVKDELAEVSLRVGDHVIRDAEMMSDGGALRFSGTLVARPNRRTLVVNDGKLTVGSPVSQLADELAEACVDTK